MTIRIALTLTLVVCSYTTVHTMSPNPFLGFCFPDWAPYITNRFDELSGRWYFKYVSWNGLDSVSDMHLQSGSALDIRYTAIADDRTGHTNVPVLILHETRANTTGCLATNDWLCEIHEKATCQGAYFAVFVPGLNKYVIGWQTFKLITTDYTSTLVILRETMLDGMSDVTVREIYVLVRNPDEEPDVRGVHWALSTFCPFPVWDLFSGLYFKLPNSSNDPCLALTPDNAPFTPNGFTQGK